MLTRNVHLETTEVYTLLKKAIDEEKCRITAESPPNRLSCRQGSLWGMTPKSSKKTIDFSLEKLEDGTLIKCSSRLTSDWLNISIAGSILALALSAVCVWMATDLGAVIATGHESFWSWLILADGTVRSDLGAMFVKLVSGLAVFLLVVIVMEFGVIVYAKKRIDATASQILMRLMS